jgi:hypothetical protein
MFLRLSKLAACSLSVLFLRSGRGMLAHPGEGGMSRTTPRWRARAPAKQTDSRRPVFWELDHRQRPLVYALHKKINMANCRQHSCYPSSDFSNPVLLVLPSSVRFHLYVLFPARLLANRPPLFVAVCGFGASRPMRNLRI